MAVRTMLPALPTELWLKIACTAAEMVKLSRVSRQFHLTCMQPEIWEHLLLVDFAFYVDLGAASPSPNSSFLDQERLECIAAIYKNTLFATGESWNDYTNACTEFIQQRGGAIPCEQINEMQRAGLKVVRKNQWEKHVAPSFLSIIYDKIPPHIVQDSSYYAFYKQTWIEVSSHLKSETDSGFCCLRHIIENFNPVLSFDENVKDFAPIKQKCRQDIETICCTLFSESGVYPDAPVIRRYYRMLFIAKRNFHILKTNQLIADTPPTVREGRIKRIALLLGRLFGALSHLRGFLYFPTSLQIGSQTLYGKSSSKFFG